MSDWRLWIIQCGATVGGFTGYWITHWLVFR